MPQTALPAFLGSPRFSFTLDGVTRTVSIGSLPFSDGAFVYEDGDVTARWTLRTAVHGYVARLTLRFPAARSVDSFSPLIARVSYAAGTPVSYTHLTLPTS